MDLASRVFTNCAKHKTLDYYCHECLVKSVGRLVEEVERLSAKIDKKKDDPLMMMFWEGVPDNGIDGASEGSDRTTR